MDNKNTQFSFQTIEEGLDKIIFTPPLVIDAYLISDEEDTPERVNVDFDFGLSLEFNLNQCYLTNYGGDWKDKTREVLKFELFHSFFHCNVDPNYSISNWALFGNLAHRVKCYEKWEFAEDPQVEIWSYDEKLNKVKTSF